MRRLLGSVVCPVAAQELESLNSPPSPSLHPQTFTAPLQGTINTLGCGTPLQNHYIVKSRSRKANSHLFGCQATIGAGNAHYREMLQTYSCHSMKTSPNISPNAPFKPMLKKTQQNKNKFTDKGMYKICWTNQSEENPLPASTPKWCGGRPAAFLGSGNETMRDRKSQLNDTDGFNKRQTNRVYKRSEASSLQRKAN